MKHQVSNLQVHASSRITSEMGCGKRQLIENPGFISQRIAKLTCDATPAALQKPLQKLLSSYKSLVFTSECFLSWFQ